MVCCSTPLAVVMGMAGPAGCVCGTNQGMTSRGWWGGVRRLQGPQSRCVCGCDCMCGCECMCLCECVYCVCVCVSECVSLTL